MAAFENGHAEFQDAIRAAGLDPPAVIEPGKIHRFPGQGKRRNNRAGWCLLYAHERGGCFGDWSSGLFKRWDPAADGFAARGRPPGTASRRTTVRDVLRRQRASDARARARAMWDRATPAPLQHPYLLRKGVGAHGARRYGHALVLPVIDFTGRLMSLQFINADGGKRLLSGGQKQGCYIPVAGHSMRATRIVICEGWATGATLAEDDGDADVLAAIDAGNLIGVATGARNRWPSAEIVIAGDDDRETPGNPGATKARAAAIAADALLALPDWPVDAPAHLTDFNDLARWRAGGRA